MPSVNFPTAQFPDANSFGVVALGKVYIGNVGEDPTVENNRIPVTVIQENGTEVVIGVGAQPFVLNSSGIFTYQGSVVQLRTTQNFSMAVHTSSNVPQYYFPSVFAGESIISDGIQLISVDDTPDSIAGTGQLYTKTINGIVEIFYQDATGQEIQFTEDGGLKVVLPEAVIDVQAVNAEGNSYAGYFTGKALELQIVGGVVSLDWHAAQYFHYINTENHTIDFSNLPLIGDDIGQTILLVIEDAGNFGITLNPGLNYDIWARDSDLPFTYTTDGVDAFVLSVFAQSKITVIPLYNFINTDP